MGVQCYVYRWPAQRRRPSLGGACRPSETHVQPTCRPYQRPWSGAQRGCTGSDSARGIFLDLCYGEYHFDCPSVFPEGTLTLGHEIIQEVACDTAQYDECHEISWNTQRRDASVAVTGCSVIFVLVQVDGVGVLEVVREVSHQEQVLSQPGAAYLFSGFPPVLGDRQESLVPGAEVYLGLLTGRFFEKLAKDFSPTLNDIRLPCKQGSSRIWDRMKLKEGRYI